jgi:drug/metabolite transporter (DMT)-like permease
MMPANHPLGIAAALGSAASWALGAFLFKALGELLSPLALTLAKGACGLLFLGGVMALLGVEPTGLRPLTLLAVSGLLGIALGDTFFFRALQGLGPQPLLLLAVFGQALTLVLAMLCLGEAPPSGTWLGGALVLAGVATVLSGNLPPPGRSTRARALCFGLLAVGCMAASSVIAKAGLTEQAGTIQATFIRLLAGTLGVFGLGMTTGRLKVWVKPLRDGKCLLQFLLSVCVVTFGGFWLGLVAFQYTSVAVASILTSTEPVFALILGASLLGETITVRAAAGTAATILGVIFLSTL